MEHKHSLADTETRPYHTSISVLIYVIQNDHQWIETTIILMHNIERFGASSRLLIPYP